MQLGLEPRFVWILSTRPYPYTDISHAMHVCVIETTQGGF